MKTVVPFSTRIELHHMPQFAHIAFPRMTFKNADSFFAQERARPAHPVCHAGQKMFGQGYNIRTALSGGVPR